jgi:hypothetical protein
MHCIKLHFAPHALHYVIVTVLCICARSRGAGTRDLRGSKAKEHGGPQVTSCEDGNVVVIKASPSAYYHVPLAFFTFSLTL